MLGSNIKIHFAGIDNSIPHKIAGDIANVKYRLFTCYPFIVDKNSNQDFRFKNNKIFVPKLIDKDCKHVIMDSGLFTLMFGAKKNEVQTIETLTEWQDRTVQFVKQNNLKCTCVEIDCQKVLGVEEAWYFRRRMKKLLPNNRHINVFHLEDGWDGLDRLIEFSDYIAISVPELRLHRRKTYKKDVVHLAKYIKNKKPSIDIHLLGCTEIGILKQCTFCTSADSTSWLSANRYGRFGKDHNHVNDIKEEVRSNYKEKILHEMKKYPYWQPKNIDNAIKYTTNAIVSAICCKKDYEKACGSQD